MTESTVNDQDGTATEYVDRDVTAGGLRLHTRRRSGGAQPPLLLIHGLGGSLDSWAPLLDALPDRDVIMIDTPGMGRSELPRRPLSIGELADKLVAGLTALGVGRVDVLGYSHGGTVAQAFVHRHPDRVRRLVLVATVAGMPFLPPRLDAQRALLSTRRYHNKAVAAQEIPILAGGRTARDPEVLEAILADREANPPSSTGYRYLQLAVMAWSSHPWLHRLRCRTLVLQGDDDPVVRVVNGRVLARRIPHAQLELVSGAGHMMLFDEPTRLGGLISDFLTQD